MNHDSNRVRSAVRRASLVPGARSFSVLVSLALTTAAQATRLVVSTTDDVPPTVGLPFPVTDTDLVTVESGAAPVPYFAGGHFLATTGFEPTDIDASARLPGSAPGRAGGFVFSLLSNEGGFLDGDLLVLDSGGGGAVLLVSELDLATALGVPSANIDVDAVTYDDTGRILFSLASDLSGTVLGAVEDGDILRLEPGFAGVTRTLAESEVQTRFTLATGLSDAILDVQALDWAGGELWVAVQSPSRHDGSIVALDGPPRVVIDENDMGLGGAEVDSLSGLRPGDEIPVFHMAPSPALPGDVMHIETRGRPGAVLLVLMSGGTGFVNFARFPGFGGWYFDPFDPWLNARLSTHTIPYVMLNGAGSFSADWALPPGLEFGTGFSGELGWSFQLMDTGTKELSAPFRIQKL